MLEPWILRVAVVPALLAVFVVMFSLESAPAPLPPALAADALFEGRSALRVTRDLVEAEPDRRAGRAGDRRTAGRVAASFRRRGYATTVDPFEAEGEQLVNVVGRRPGASRRSLVVLAGRDAATVPDVAASGADTAVLLELARALEGRATRKTLVLASVDGSTVGGFGARRLAETMEDRDRIDAVLVLSNLGAPRARGPLLVGWSNAPGRHSLGLERTVAEALREELIEPGAPEGVGGQVARLAFPLGVGDQGVLLENGLEAVRLSGSGELPLPGPVTPEDVDVERLGALGRSVLRTHSALDEQAPPLRGPRSYVTVGPQLVPEWALSLLALSLALPALAVSVDAFARARRRRAALGQWAWCIPAAGLPWLLALGVAELLALVGLVPSAPPAAFAPALHPAGVGAAVVLGLLGLVVVGLLVFGARALRRRPERPGALDGLGARAALALALAALGLLVWALNPFAALVLAPGLGLLTVALLAEWRPRSPLPVGLAVAGLVPLLAVAVHRLDPLGLGPIEGGWYALLLITGGHVSTLVTVLGCLGLGVWTLAVASLLVRAGRPPPPPPVRATVRPGLGRHAGPGSLGGTRSALPRR